MKNQLTKKRLRYSEWFVKEREAQEVKVNQWLKQTKIDQINQNYLPT